jgi:RNA polymerase sigma-70 factor (ECF subfamily)
LVSTEILTVEATCRFAMAGDDDSQLLAAVREGDEQAFITHVERYHSSLLRLARVYVEPSAAEDVVQDTWIGVLRGVSSFP